MQNAAEKEISQYQLEALRWLKSPLVCIENKQYRNLFKSNTASTNQSELCVWKYRLYTSLIGGG